MFSFLGLSAQKVEFSGLHDLKMGASHKSVKKLLKKKKIESYFNRTPAKIDPEILEEMGDDPFMYEDEDVPPEGCYRCVYEVKLKKKKFRSLAGNKIEAIEVEFDDENKISNILVMMDKSDKDKMLDVYGACLTSLGDTFCTQGVDGPPSIYCIWDDTENRIEVKLFDWDGIGEGDYDEFLWLEWRQAR